MLSVRYKSPVFNAEQYTENNIPQLVRGLNPNKLCGCCLLGGPGNNYPHVHVTLLGNARKVEIGDWILWLPGEKLVTDVCTDEKFKEKYENITT